MLDDLVHSLNDDSNIETLAGTRQTHILSNNILGHGKKERGLNGESKLLKNQS